MKKVYIVGIGMDGNSTLTQQARAAISSADCLIGAARMLEPFSALSKPCFTSWNSGEIAGYILDSGYDKFAVLMSGDCGYFSGAEGLLMALPDSVRAEVISGISSPVYFCGKLGIPWQDIPTVNLHGESANIARNAAMHRRCFFLLGGKSGAREVCRRLCEYGLGGMTVHIGERLGYPQERVISGTAEGFTDIETDRLSVMLTENPAPETHIRTGIPDEEFIRDKVPMTKSEVRALVISRLGICPGDTVWDIGCGTGSVSVEMALQCYRGAVYSIDVKPEAAELTRRNAVKFHCDNIIVRTGSAPGDTSDFPAPDKVFVGGSGGDLRGIVSAAVSRNPAAVIVITAVSLETLHEAVESLAGQGISPEIIQAAVTRTRKLGSHTMLAAENPVFIIKGAGKCAE